VTETAGKTCCVFLILIGVVSGNGESGALQRDSRSTSTWPSALLVLPGAKKVKTSKRNDGEVSYTLQEAWPAEKTIALIGGRLEAEGWQPSATYLLGSGTVGLRMWTPVILGRQTVFGWWGQWNKSDGSVAIYVLQYKVAGTTGDVRPAGPLYVDARFFSPATAETLRNAK
jgi:hypothetical protein